MLLIRRFSACAVALALLGACSSSASDGGGSGGAAGAASDSGPLEVQAIEYDQVTESYEPLVDGGQVQLVRPPQGGQVIFVGARVKNLDSTTIELTGRVRDATTHAIVQQDTRTVVMEPVPGMPGWLQTDHRSISQVANVALCPDYDPVDIVARPYLVEVEVTELYAQDSTGSVGVSLTPTCAQADPADQALCECECHANYVLGHCNGGTLDGGPGDAAAD